ncbi:hypothetical protein [Chryseobacterium sp.]|uniref:GAP1-N1 domain-containing protein n=1 Tax=Chryseobacterium sp. TaxID=1871047 RepID=UPI003340AD48
MKIEIHQSICGEVNRAWGLIKTTMPDAILAKNIAFRSDLQDQTSGILWSPAIRGFVESGYFVILKTFEDTSGEVRRGRKFSHVLSVPFKQIVHLSTLEHFFELLYDRIDKASPIHTINLEINERNDVLRFTEHNGRIAKLLNGYINIKAYENNIIWIGQDEFKTAVNELWQRLTLYEKERFQFGIVFNNALSKRDGINLYAAPDSIYSKFIKSNFFIVGKKDFHAPEELIEKYIIGDIDARNRIRNFEKSIESAQLSREEVKLISVGIETFENIDSISDLKKLNTLGHIIAKYSPSENSGIAFKKKLLNKIIESAKGKTIAELNILRNFKVKSFSGSKALLSKLVKDWMKKNIFSIKSPSSVLQSFFDGGRDNNLLWWDLVFEAELQDFLHELNPLKTTIVLNWIEKYPKIVQQIIPVLDRSDHAEDLFIKKLASSLKEDQNNALIILSKAFNWYRLYATLLSYSFEAKDALSLLIEVDKDDQSYAALDIIIKKAKDNDVLDFTLESGDSRLLKISSRLCNNDPSLLNNIDVSDERWQKIWEGAIKLGSRLDAGFEEPERIIISIYDFIISGGKIIENLLCTISLSNYGNLLEYNNRNILWKHLSANVKGNFLVKTSSVLLEALSKDSSTVIPDDNVLLQHVSDTGINDFLYFNRSNISSVIPLFDRFPHLSDDYLRDYLMNFSGKLTDYQSLSLGKMVLKKQFVNSAYYIHSRADKNNNWKYALIECHYLLDFITKAGLVFTNIFPKDKKINIPSDQWWYALEDFVTEYYSNGGSLTTAWIRAGGKEADLKMNSTPAELWSFLLKKLRRDQFKSIKTYKLLETIRKDYGNVQQFKNIYKLRKNYIKT